MADKKERRKYPLDFKQDAVRLTNKIGVAQAADKLDIPLSTLQRWRCLKSALPVEGGGCLGIFQWGGSF